MVQEVELQELLARELPMLLGEGEDRRAQEALQEMEALLLVLRSREELEAPRQTTNSVAVMEGAEAAAFMEGAEAGQEINFSCFIT